MKKRRDSFLFGYFIYPGGFFLILLILIGLLRQVTVNTGFFLVKDIIVKEKNPPKNDIRGSNYKNDANSKKKFSYLKGRNIFAVDLHREEQSAVELFPDCKNITLIKVLPDRLFAILTRRRAIAFLKLNKYYYIDDEAVLFDVSGGYEQYEIAENLVKDQGLPVIFGLHNKIFSTKLGKRCNVRELLTALDMIKEINNTQIPNLLRLKRIDILGRHSNIVFMPIPIQKLDQRQIAHSMRIETLEVRIGYDRIADKISILSNLLLQENNEIKNIKYIDLRFKEAVMKFKDKV